MSREQNEARLSEVRALAASMREAQRKTLTIRGEEFYAIGPLVTPEWIDEMQAELDRQEDEELAAFEAEGTDVELTECEIAPEGCDCDFCFCEMLRRG